VTTDIATDNLDLAYDLADCGAPVFAGRITADGNPDRNDRRWDNWPNARTGTRAIDRSRDGDAFAMVCGVKYDVIDIDPRNGGKASFRKMATDLGDNGPERYLEVSTPSGGLHLYIEPLGLGTIHGFLPGIDLQGGLPDGKSRGFVFIPPTRRMSKLTATLRPYMARGTLREMDGYRSGAAISRYIEACLSQRHGAQDTTRRTSARELRARAKAAERGEQRYALLRYVHELERVGIDPDDIIDQLFSLNLVNYDPRRPWDETAFIGLLHHDGDVIPDASPAEMAMLRGIEPVRTGLVTRMSTVAARQISWLWEPYLSVGEFILLDGEKGVGKTFVLCDVAARGSTGRAMPGAAEALAEPFNVLYFSYEGESAFQPRLLAAGADMDRVFMPNLGEAPKRSSRTELDPLALPGGAQKIKRMIREADAKLAIFDPIVDFLDRDVQSHNDASVRVALRPLGEVLLATGCAGLGIRHMNKDTGAKISFRGSGSTAFQNRSRVHLVSVELPAEHVTGDDRQFILGMADANDVQRVKGSLAYRLVDSDVRLDAQTGRKVGKVEWDGHVDIDVHDLAKKRGPVAYAQREIIELLTPMFDERDVIPASDIREALEEAGLSTAQSVLTKVCEEMDIKRRQIRGSGAHAGWVWERQVIRTMNADRAHGQTRGRRGRSSP